MLEDRIIDQSEELASRLGVWELIKNDTPEHSLSGKAKKPLNYWRTATGTLMPLGELIPYWLETIDNKKTCSDYNRALTLLSRKFVVAEEIT